MTNPQQQQQLIAPSPKQVAAWTGQWLDGDTSEVYAESLATRAAQWGADQELEACCEWLKLRAWDEASQQLIADLRADRRPKPPSLKRLALEAMQEMRIEPCVIDGVNVNAALQAKHDIIILALEQLDD